MTLLQAFKCNPRSARLALIQNQPRKIFRNTLALVGSRAIERVSSVALGLFVARYLGATGLGIYSTAMVFFGLILLAGEMGATNFLVRELSKDRSCTNTYLVHLGGITVLLSMGMMLVSWIVTSKLGYSKELTAGIHIVILAIIPGVLKTIQEAVFVAHQRVEFITYSSLIAAVVNTGTTMYLLQHGYRSTGVLLSFAIVQYVVSLCYFVFINSYISRVQWRFNVRFAFGLLKEVKTFAGCSLLGGLIARPEILILSVFRDEAQVGFYSAALRIVDLWQLVPQTYMTNVFPVLARAEHSADCQKARVLVEKSIKYLLTLSLPLLVGIFVAGGPILRLAYGPGFEIAIPLVRVLAWSMPLASVSSVLWRLLVARDQQHLVLRAQLGVTLFRLGGGVALIAWSSALGAALTMTVSMLLYNFLLEFYVWRGGTRFEVFREAWRIAVAAVAMGPVAAYLINRSQIWITVPLAAAAYTGFMILLRGFAPDDFALIRKVWHTQPADAD